MPDDIFGAPLPEGSRPKRKRQLADRDQRTPADRVRDCLDYPLLYEMAELLPPPNTVGCPREYPAIVYLIMAALTPVTGSKRSTAGLLAAPPPRTGAACVPASDATSAAGPRRRCPSPRRPEASTRTR
ncbi:hypothetical protein EDD96_4911 [Streptomyces sp. Ag109_G2-6]|nr:hypothetical protein EDD96_4911 [Streptomyces sp. Ag109_G2-6]